MPQDEIPRQPVSPHPGAPGAPCQGQAQAWPGLPVHPVPFDHALSAVIDWLMLIEDRQQGARRMRGLCEAPQSPARLSPAVGVADGFPTPWGWRCGKGEASH